MKKHFWILIICLFYQQANGQFCKISLYSGFGIYQLTDLKNYQTDLKEMYPDLQIEEVEQFPGYINYSASLEFLLSNRDLAEITTTFLTTGGRNHVRDYSGEYKLDMPLDGLRIGIQHRRIITTNDKLNVYSKIMLGAMLSKLQLKESITLYNVDSTSSSYTFRSNSFSGEPGIGLLYPIGNNFSLDFCLGYQIDIKSKLYLKGDKNMELLKPNGDNVYVNWSGLRFYLGVSYDLF